MDVAETEIKVYLYTVKWIQWQNHLAWNEQDQNYQLCDQRVSAHLRLYGPEQTQLSYAGNLLVPNYTACCQRHMYVNNLPRVVSRWCNRWEL